MKISAILEDVNSDDDDTEIDGEEDTIINIDHSRRPRITLLHLQKLRKLRAVEDIENKTRLSTIGNMYGSQ
jgi:hypothetical protein